MPAHTYEQVVEGTMMTLLSDAWSTQVTLLKQEGDGERDGEDNTTTKANNEGNSEDGADGDQDSERDGDNNATTAANDEGNSEDGANSDQDGDRAAGSSQDVDEDTHEAEGTGHQGRYKAEGAGRQEMYKAEGTGRQGRNKD